MDGNETEFLDLLDYVKNNKQVSNFFTVISKFKNAHYDSNEITYKNCDLWKIFIDLSIKYTYK